jgi:hypothetical protein
MAWTASSGSLLQAVETVFKESLAPLADNLGGGVQTNSDVLVLQASGRQEDDLGPDDFTIR